MVIRPAGEAVGERRKEMRHWKLFYRDQSAQDLVEYSLLMAFVCLVSAALFIGVGKTVSSIWSTTNTSLSQAYSAANASS
jgi:Flp pilus assembly pilin Flp